MTERSESKEIIKRFLFGEMAEGERSDFEASFMSDSELFEEIKTIEDDLIERYLCKMLDQNDAEKFELSFLATKKRREKVEFNRQLIEELRAGTANKTKYETISIWERISSIFRLRHIAYGAALASLILVVGGWLVLRNYNSEPLKVALDSNSNIYANGNSREGDVNKVPTGNTNQNREANSETNRTKETKPSPSPLKTPEPKIEPKKEPNLVSPNPVLALFAGTVRSDGDSNELKLPRKSQGATLQLNLQSPEYEIFTAAISDGNGNVIFRSGKLKLQKTKVSVFVPAYKLPSGDYRISLSGINAEGDSESAADFQFRVIRPN